MGSKPRSMIFHYPLPLVDQPRAGGQLRTARMVEAFREIGYYVELVTGYAKERGAAVQRVKALLQEGHVFDFAYSESSTMPTLLTEPHHLPTHPTLDFNFFRLLKQHSVPIGLFYRDIHWKFEQYRRQTTFLKRWFAKPFYWGDWFGYRWLVNHLFLPTKAMRRVLPTEWPQGRLSALPPGCEETEGVGTQVPNLEVASHSDTSLKLFYVGGVRPPLYDVKPLIEVAEHVEGIVLILCCRKEEWEAEAKYYGVPDFRRVRVVHASGEELKSYYQEADILFDVWSESPYRAFAFPTKIAEALGYCVPILTWGGTEAARFVEQNDIGWTLGSTEEVIDLLHYLRRNRQDIQRKRERMQSVRTQHTWECRAREVEKQLKVGSSIDGKDPI